MAAKKKSFVRKVAKSVKRRYFKGSGFGKPKIVRMAKDVAYLKSVLNPEKKTYSINTNGIPIAIGQVAGNLNGFYSFDVTPAPAQGTTSITRTGNSIKLHSSFIRFQFFQQSATTSQIKIKIQLVLVKGQPATVATFPSGILLDPNPFITGANIYDYNSSYNPDYFGTFKVLRTKTATLKPDNISSQTGIVDISMPMKYMRGQGHHVRFVQDASQAIADGQIIMVITTDTGNCSTGTASTLNGIATGNTAINTGMWMNWNIVHYYYDN